jgi:hypothetical protein
MRKLIAALCLLFPSAALADLLDVLATVPEGSWIKANVNTFSSVWTPAAQRPLYGLSNTTPERIISAWGGMAWDANRARVWAYGGGHANYTGNDVYYWSAVTRAWHRASLPSEIAPVGVNAQYQAIDGVDFAPSAAHTYDNNIFLPILDRLLTFGGGGFNSGGAYMTRASATTFRRTGPYLFNPNLANANKVGGSHGSHVKRVAPYPEVEGGFMWDNRDLPLMIPAAPLPNSHVNGCTAYAQEGGQDVAYVVARRGSSAVQHLFRYQIRDVNNPALDLWQQVGRYWAGGTTDQSACGYDPLTRLFFRTGKYGFAYWRVNGPSTINNDVRASMFDAGGVLLPLLPAGTFLRYCGMDFDPVRRRFVLWCGDGRVWNIALPNAAGQWVVTLAPTPGGAVPSATLNGRGIIGKWLYARNLDAFVGVQHKTEGRVWVYKPIGWKRPAALVSELAPGVPQATIAWDYEQADTLSGFRVYCAPVVGEWTAPRITTGAEARMATFTYEGQTFCTVHAVDPAGESDDSNVVELS